MSEDPPENAGTEEELEPEASVDDAGPPIEGPVGEEAGPVGDEAGPGDEPGDEERAPARPEDVAEVAEEFVRGLLDAMGLDAEIESSVEGESAFVDVTGDGLGILIGRRGQTLDALQEVARTAVQRRLRARIRLLVDVEGYRARRRNSLADYAKAMALRAKERGTEIELEPMTAYERKIVHDAVGEVEGASSFSEGAEPYRKVVVRGE
jgi:spoIIIJ-associated protein